MFLSAAAVSSRWHTHHRTSSVPTFLSAAAVSSRLHTHHRSSSVPTFLSAAAVSFWWHTYHRTSSVPTFLSAAVVFSRWNTQSLLCSPSSSVCLISLQQKTLSNAIQIFLSCISIFTRSLLSLIIPSSSGCLVNAKLPILRLLLEKRSCKEGTDKCGRSIVGKYIIIWDRNVTEPQSRETYENHQWRRGLSGKKKDRANNKEFVIVKKEVKLWP
jgi:hypothetical protein